MLNRCIPSFAEVNRTAQGIDSEDELAGLISESRARETSAIIFGDLYEARFITIAFVAMAVGLGFVWILFLRMCGGCMTWLTILLVLGALFSITYFFYAESACASAGISSIWTGECIRVQR